MRDEVSRRYAAVAVSVREGEGLRAAGPGRKGCSTRRRRGDCTGGSYSKVEKLELPEAAMEASLGCGNPVAPATLCAGEVVLDLGSGGGIDVLLSARRASPGGKAYGLDMTDEMVGLARENRRKAGIENAEFLKGR